MKLLRLLLQRGPRCLSHSPPPCTIIFPRSTIHPAFHFPRPRRVCHEPRELALFNRVVVASWPRHSLVVCIQRWIHSCGVLIIPQRRACCTRARFIFPALGSYSNRESLESQCRMRRRSSSENSLRLQPLTQPTKQPTPGT